MAYRNTTSTTLSPKNSCYSTVRTSRHSTPPWPPTSKTTKRTERKLGKPWCLRLSIYRFELPEGASPRGHELDCWGSCFVLGGFNPFQTVNGRIIPKMGWSLFFKKMQKVHQSTKQFILGAPFYVALPQGIRQLRRKNRESPGSHQTFQLLLSSNCPKISCIIALKSLTTRGWTVTARVNPSPRALLSPSKYTKSLACKQLRLCSRSARGLWSWTRCWDLGPHSVRWYPSWTMLEVLKMHLAPWFIGVLRQHESLRFTISSLEVPAEVTTTCLSKQIRKVALCHCQQFEDRLPIVTFSLLTEYTEYDIHVNIWGVQVKPTNQPTNPEPLPTYRGPLSNHW